VNITYMINKMYSDSHYLLTRFMATDNNSSSLGYFYSEHLSALTLFTNDIPCRGVDILCKSSAIISYISVAIRV